MNQDGPGSTQRLVAALAIVAAPLVIVVPLVLSWRDRLPTNLASHWGLGAAPDGFTERDGFLDGFAIVSAIVLALCILIAPLVKRGRRTAVLVMGAVTGFVASLGLVITLSNLDLADPRDATVSWGAAVPLIVMLVVAALAWWVHGPSGDQPILADAPPPGELPRLALGEAPRFEETQIHWASAALAFAVLAGLGVVITVRLTPWLGVELIILGVLVAWFARSRLRVSAEDDIALSVGLITHRVPISEVTGARARDDVNPFGEFGGWGLRYRPKAIGLVVRKGSGVDVGRTDERRVVITARDAERLAAVINTLADERFAQQVHSR